MAQPQEDIEKAAASGSNTTESSPTRVQERKRPSIREYWMKDVETKYGDWLLFGCCVTTGLLDSSTFRNYGTFVSMQTGNTVILCLSTAGFPPGQPYAWATTLLSLCSFFIGAFVHTRVATYFGPKRRITLLLNFLAQACLIALAAGLATGHILIGDGNSNVDSGEVLQNPRILIALGPLAWQSGATIATSRLLGFGNEIPCTVYTSTYAALAADPKLFALPTKNKPRDRRVIAVISIFSGALMAAWLERRSEGLIATFWFSAAIKFTIVLAVAFLLPTKKPAADAVKK